MSASRGLTTTRMDLHLHPWLPHTPKSANERRLPLQRGFHSSTARVVKPKTCIPFVTASSCLRFAAEYLSLVMIALILVSIASPSIKFSESLLYKHVPLWQKCNQIHPSKIPWTSNFNICNFTAPSSSSACKGLVPRLVRIHQRGQVINTILHKYRGNGKTCASSQYQAVSLLPHSLGIRLTYRQDI